jgi:hypothetical protein
MSYNINKTDGEVLTTLLDGTLNTDTGLTLIGRNYPTYGEFQNENFVRLLENFASNLPPGQSVGFAPIAGQLWWDTTNRRLKVYDSTSGQFITVSEQYVSSTSPSTGIKTGDQWYNTTTNQLFAYTGSAWQLVGPIYTTAQGISGEAVTSITDTNSNSRVAVQYYSGGNVYAIASGVAEYRPSAAITGFGNIIPGINLISSAILNGTANNSTRLDGISRTAFARTDIDTTFYGNVGISGTLTLTNGNIYYANNALILQNKASNGNLDVYVTSSTLGNVRALRVSGSSGLAYVTGDPVTSTGVATKNYVDTTNASTAASIDAVRSQIDGNVTALRVDYLANISLVNTTFTNSINNLHTLLDSNITSLSTSTDNRFTAANANAAVQSVSITNLVADVALKSYINSPAFTGSPTAPNVAPFNNSNRIATTSYVDNSASTLYADYSNQFDTSAATNASNLTNGLALKANINSPSLTGIPTSVTPTAGNSSTMIATTAFVQTTVSTNKFNYTVATTAAGDTSGVISSTNNAAGNDGDFWFQIG